MAADYKARKEAFVSNLSGSSLTEINLVTLVAAAAVFLWTALQRRHSFFTPPTVISGVVDFLLNVCAILFAITLYSATPAVLAIFLITPALLLLFLGADGSPKTHTANTTAASKPGRKTGRTAVPTSQKPSPTLVVRPFLTHYRGSMLVVTCLAILAVDFPIFPRRFAKVETWGTSLMDLGVGSFVFSAGVVSARAVVRHTTQTLGGRLVQTVQHSLPLWVLGLVRLWSVKGLDYAEHVTEYGVHWNFFFTLALLPPFVELSDSVSRSLPYLWRYQSLALVLGVGYEVVLDNTTLLSYILAAPRTDLLSKNREGVFSFAGYLAIFLCGRGTGLPLVQLNSPRDAHGPRDAPTNDSEITRRERRHVLKLLGVQSLTFVLLYCLSTSFYTFNLTVSRRLANLPYVLWVVAFNNAQILLFGVVEDCGPAFSYSSQDHPRWTAAVSHTLKVFNNNGLVIFLVANLLTGLVNLTVNTLDMPPLHAMAVLIVYAVVVTSVALGLDASGVRIKI